MRLPTAGIRTTLRLLVISGWFTMPPFGIVHAGPAGGSEPDFAESPVLFPALRTAASSHGIPVDGLDKPDPGRKLAAGDSVTALFLTSKSGRVSQWLVQLKVVAPAGTARDGHDGDIVLYTGSGNQMQFKSGVARMKVSILGPVTEESVDPEDCPERSIAAGAHEDYLRFGAFGMCGVVQRFTKSAKDLQISFSTVPFSPEDIAKGRKIEQEAGVSRDDEAAFAGGAVALNEFTANAEGIPGIMGIATQGMDWPSMWTMLREMNFNIWSTIDWKDETKVDQKVPGGSVQAYRLPFDLYMFGSHISHGGWFIAKPDSPVSVCGGIVGIWLQSVKHPENRMFMRVISAHRGS